MAKILIVEDEFPVALDLKISLEEIGHEVIGIANNYEKAIQHTTIYIPDIVIMDIHIHGNINGISTAQEIYEKYQIPVIFLSANGDDATFKQALQSKPFGFLLKPYKIKELSFMLEVVLQKHLEGRNNLETITKIADTIFVKDKSKLIGVKITDILWVEAMDNYTKIFTKDKMVLANMFLKELYEKVPHDKFFRVHRSYIIALEKIEKIENQSIYIGDKIIPISKAYKNKLMEHLDIL